jgi:four helix bundle protein
VQDATAMSTNRPLPHERLLAYQLAMQLLKQIQELKIVDARLRDQLLRASKSVCLNIAEGVGRFSTADKKRVFAIARGECCETAAALDIAKLTEDCDLADAGAARETAGRVYALLTGLIRRYESETPGSKTSQSNGNGNELDTLNEKELELELDDRHGS